MCCGLLTVPPTLQQWECVLIKQDKAPKQTNPFLPSGQILLVFSVENTGKVPEPVFKPVKTIVNIALKKA